MTNILYSRNVRHISKALIAALLINLPAAQALNEIIIDRERPTALDLGHPEAQITESTKVTVTSTGSIFANDSGSPNPIRAYLGGSADFTLENSGLLDGLWGVFAQSMGTGNIMINNNADGIYAGEDYAVYAMSNSGAISVSNAGMISGSAEVATEWYHGTVVMESIGGGAVSFENTGSVLGKWYSSPSAYSPAAVTADTAGSVNLTNRGTISTLAGEGPESGRAGMGIYVTSAATSGTVVNSGTISAATAINVQGSGIAVRLENGSDITGDILIGGTGNSLAFESASQSLTGNLTLGGNNNTLILGRDGVSINGNVTLGSGNALHLDFANTASAAAFLSSTGRIDLTGANLTFSFDSDSLVVGETYTLLHGMSGIDGWFASINGALTDGTFDSSAIYAIGGGYEVQFSYADTGFGRDLNMFVVVPEPSSYAAFIAVAVLGLGILRRRCVRVRTRASACASARA